MWTEELQRLFTTLENSAIGDCKGMVCVDKAALEALAEAFGTWPELQPGTDDGRAH
jgi:hypothetical protein